MVATEKKIFFFGSRCATPTATRKHLTLILLRTEAPIHLLQAVEKQPREKTNSFQAQLRVKWQTIGTAIVHISLPRLSAALGKPKSVAATPMLLRDLVQLLVYPTNSLVYVCVHLGTRWSAHKQVIISLSKHSKKCKVSDFFFFKKKESYGKLRPSLQRDWIRHYKESIKIETKKSATARQSHWLHGNQIIRGNLQIFS